MNTSQWIDFVNSETETALALLYSYIKFQELLADKEAVEVINRNAEFWMLHNGAVQHTLFLYLGRIADDTKDGKSFSDFQSRCIFNIEEFSRKEFLLRKPNILDINKNFLDGKVEPTMEDFNALFKMASPHNAFLRGACKTIRSKVFAHAIFTERHEYEDLFSQVSLADIEKSLLAYWSISQHIWQCYHNARTIEPKILEYHEKKNIFKNLTRAVYGASNKSINCAPSAPDS